VSKGAWIWTILGVSLLLYTAYKIDQNRYYLDELKELAEEGKIPYEVYELAKFEKVKTGKDSWYYYDGKFVRTRDGNLVLEGKYVKVINESAVEVVYVFYDDTYTKDYVILKAIVPLGILKEDEHLYEYLKRGNSVAYISHFFGFDVLAEGRFENFTAPLEFYIRYCPGKKDAILVKEIVDELKRIQREKGLSKKDVVGLWLSLVPRMLEPDVGATGYGLYYPKNITAEAMRGDELVEINLKSSVSMMEYLLLYGRGVCSDYVWLAASVLNGLGVKAYGFAYTFETDVVNGTEVYGRHEVLFLPSNATNVSRLGLSSCHEYTYVVEQVKSTRAYGVFGESGRGYLIDLISGGRCVVPEKISDEPWKYQLIYYHFLKK